MLNNFSKFIKNIILTASVLLCGTDTVFAAGKLAMIKPVAIKYSLAMAAILFFSLLIYVGLSLYNRFFVPMHIKDFKFGESSLRVPSDKDNAILAFIRKNRLR